MSHLFSPSTGDRRFRPGCIMQEHSRVGQRAAEAFAEWRGGGAE
jgi:hypothetical protein